MEAAGDADLSSWAVAQGEDQQPPPLPAEDFELGVEAEQLEAVEAQVFELRRIVKVAAELVRAEEQELEYLRAQSRSTARGGETAEQRRRRLAAERKAELAAQSKHAGPRPALRT